MTKAVQAGDVVVLDEKNPHIDGTVIKLEVNTGVYTMDMRVCLDETLVLWSADKDSEWPECHKQTCNTKGEVQQ